ncbi:MAG: four helix bundle protein, partial [bacterium]
TNTFPKTEQYSLIDQMRRAAISIASNIAEGFKRSSVKDKLHFYNIAESSLEELKYQLLLSKDLEYISQNEYLPINNAADQTGGTLANWIKGHS